MINAGCYGCNRTRLIQSVCRSAGRRHRGDQVHQIDEHLVNDEPSVDDEVEQLSSFHGIQLSDGVADLRIRGN